MNHLQGWIPTPQRFRSLLYAQAEKALGVSAIEQMPMGDPPPISLPFKGVRLFLPSAFEDEPQVGPDCTTHGTRAAANISRCNEILVLNEPESFEGQLATEMTYAMRGHRGGGMNCGRAIQVYVKHGMLLRKRYNSIDLSTYNKSTLDWATRTSSVPQELLDAAARHPFKYFLRIKTIDGIRAALASGYGVIIGSQIGTGNVRGAKGRCKWTTNWNHCMCFGGYETSDDLYFLILNSWGKWNSGPHPDFGEIPGGSFMLHHSIIAKAMRDQYTEVWALGDSTGFPAKQLPDYGSASFL